MIDARIIEEFNKKAPFKWEDGLLVSLCLIGSHSHGTYIPSNDPNSIDDVDYMGVILPPPSHAFGLKSITGHAWKSTVIKRDELDVVFYSLQHYIHLLLKGNPNVIGLLWLNPNCYIRHSWLWNILNLNRHLFVSKKSYEAFRGIAKSHFEGMKKEGAYKGYMGEKRKKIVDQYGYDVKDAAHMIRILKMGIEFLETGQMNVDRTGIDAEFIKDIKTGKYDLQDILEMWETLDSVIEEAYEKSTLPENVDYDKIDQLTQKLILQGYSLDKFDLSY